MNPLDPYERVFIHTLLSIHFISLLAALVFLMIVREKAHKSSLKNSFLVVHSMIIIWIIGKILKTIAPVLALRWSFNILYYIGILPIGPAFFIFSCNLLNYKIGRRVRAILYIPSLAMFAIMISNPLHYLFYSKYNFFKDSFGPLFYVHFSITYLFMISSVLLLLYGAYKFKEVKLKAFALISGALFPLVININYIFDFINPMFDITPIVYNISIIILGFAAFLYDFFNFIPEAIAIALNSLPGAVKVDNDLYGADTDTPFKKHIREEYSITVHNSDILIERYINTESIHRETERLRKVESSISQANHQLNSEIEKRVSLLLRNEKMKLAGEVHDILGYSISSVICLLEHCRFSQLIGREYNQNLARAMLLVSSSIEELDSLHFCKEELIWKKRFLQLLSELEIHNISYELITLPKDDFPETAYKILYKVLKESVTNCLRYSSASKLTIAINKVSNNINMHIIDNGIGCNQLVEGNGLSNMRQRIEDLNGEIRFFSEEDSGFLIFIRFPVLQRKERPVSYQTVLSL